MIYYFSKKEKKQHNRDHALVPPVPLSLISQGTLLCHALSEEPYLCATYAASWSQ